jgi:hypothetical protein
MQSTSKKRLAARQRARGVALVEAGILAPIFAMMMMMTVYLGGVYNAKYQSFMDARQKAWYNASNNCDPEGSSESLNSSGYGTPSETNNGAGANADGDSRSGASSSWDVSHGHGERTFDYTPTYKFNNNGPKQVSTDSYTMCNSKKYGKNVFTYMWGAIKGFISGG